MNSKVVNSVIEEMFPGVKMRKRKGSDDPPAGAGDPPASQGSDEEPAKGEQEKPPYYVPRKRRIRQAKAEQKTEELLDANMYGISLVGGVVMPGYQLRPGEKLVIAKLTPLVIEK